MCRTVNALRYRERYVTMRIKWKDCCSAPVLPLHTILSLFRAGALAGIGTDREIAREVFASGSVASLSSPVTPAAIFIGAGLHPNMSTKGLSYKMPEERAMFPVISSNCDSLDQLAQKKNRTTPRQTIPHIFRNFLNLRSSRLTRNGREGNNLSVKRFRRTDIALFFIAPQFAKMRRFMIICKSVISRGVFVEEELINSTFMEMEKRIRGFKKTS